MKEFRGYKWVTDTANAASAGHRKTRADLGASPKVRLKPRTQLNAVEPVSDYRYLLSPETQAELRRREA